MKNAMLIVNPSSGKEEALNYVEEIEGILNKQGYEVNVSQTEKELDATRFCQSACKDEYDLVVSLGGDGTLHETINGLIDEHHRPKLGIIPMGTVNDFARALNIPLNPEKAIDVLRHHQTRMVDIGTFNDDYFVNIVAVGALAEATYDVTPEEKTKLGPLAYVVEGMKTLASNPSYPLTIEHDGEKWEGDSLLFLAALTNSIGGFENLAPDAEVDDGVLHCYIINDINVLKLPAILTSILAGKLKKNKDVTYFKARELRISSFEELNTNVDGEEGRKLPIELGIMPNHIDVMVPLKE
ncbi:diacylglycerol kinase family protein [Bacillus sp. Marseille-Q1617]|uniref:diacylglycerol/lipid kinase family protein n=1 Tax=Bacillus sp. Marseille-Q1617 TaxID=2736887 RepID=UPI00158AE45E|nr:diacylglycerol kinase family protein [Bacillus sp. Marseille-Q1617]